MNSFEENIPDKYDDVYNKYEAKMAHVVDLHNNIARWWWNNLHRNHHPCFTRNQLENKCMTVMLTPNINKNCTGAFKKFFWYPVIS
jgi:hypothetical protein